MTVGPIMTRGGLLQQGERIVEQANDFAAMSPMWWVTRLYSRLQARMNIINVYDDYYCGMFPLPWLSPLAHDEFRRILRMSRANYCGLVVDAQVERMAVEGFRIDTGQDLKDQSANLGPVIPSPQVTGAIGAAAQGKSLNIPIPGATSANPANSGQPLTATGTKGSSPFPGSIGVSKGSRYSQTTIGEADRETWRIWQANNMDTLFDQALLEAAICGVAYVMVAPNNDDPKTPKMWVEHPSQCIVEHQPGTNRQVVQAGLRVWLNDQTRMINATLYLVDDDELHIYKYQAKMPQTQELRARDWQPRIDPDEEWPAVESDIAMVPIFELPNNPRLLSGGRSELEDILDTQDRIIKTIADRLVAQDFGAFPQKWASGWPEQDVNGNPNQQIDVGQDRMITTDVPEARFGQFDATDLTGYMAGKKEDVHDMAARTRTPAQYLLGEFSNVNGETLKASESGLVAKVRQRMRGMDDPLESAIRFARQLAGTAIADDVTMEVVWRNPEFRTEGEVVAALETMSRLGVPMQALWERWGASPPEIARWTQMQVEYQAQQAQNDATALLADQYNKAAVKSATDGTSGPSSGGASNAARTPGSPGAGGGGSHNGGGNRRP
jgi:hypothetical protein